jgi:hypothetical protein
MWAYLWLLQFHLFQATFRSLRLWPAHSCMRRSTLQQVSVRTRRHRSAQASHQLRGKTDTFGDSGRTCPASLQSAQPLTLHLRKHADSSSACCGPQIGGSDASASYQASAASAQRLLALNWCCSHQEELKSVPATALCGMGEKWAWAWTELYQAHQQIAIHAL